MFCQAKYFFRNILYFEKKKPRSDCRYGDWAEKRLLSRNSETAGPIFEQYIARSGLDDRVVLCRILRLGLSIKILLVRPLLLRKLCRFSVDIAVHFCFLYEIKR